MDELLGGLLLIAIAVGLIYLYLKVVSLFFVGAAPTLLAILAGIFSLLVVKNHVIAWWTQIVRSSNPDTPVGPEPAFKTYFFRKWWPDYCAVVKESHRLNVALQKKAFSIGSKLLNGNGAVLFLTWPIALLVYTASIVGLLAGLATFLVFSAIHLLVVLLIVLIAACSSLFFRGLEAISMITQRIFLVCPHSGCYKKISRPVYHCHNPNCNAKHKTLRPGSYGTFQRRCKCGELLPTLFLFGRNELSSACPHCSKPLTFVLVRNLHLPIVGGASAGKTCYLSATMVELDREQEKEALTLSFPEKIQESNFKACRRDFEQGREPMKTRKEAPNAALVEIADSNLRRRAIYTYDAAGEFFQQWDELRQHTYYGYIHGLIFLIDPFSLSTQSKHSNPNDKPSADDPEEIYNRMIGNLRSFTDRKGRFQRQPCAVVVTKSDAVQGLRGSGESVRDWLSKNGASNLVRAIEHDFAKVEFFACSALGRTPDNSPEPYAPEAVIEPYAWLLAHYGLRLSSTPTFAGTARRLLAEWFDHLERWSNHNQNVGIASVILGIAAFFLPSPANLVALTFALLVGVLAFRRAQLNLGQGAWAAVLGLALLWVHGGVAGWTNYSTRAEGKRLINLAEKALTEGRYGEAKSSFQSALALDLENTWYAGSLVQHAKDGLTHSEKLRRENAEKNLSDAKTFLNDGHLKESEEHFEQTLMIALEPPAFNDLIEQAEAGLDEIVERRLKTLMQQGDESLKTKKYKQARYYFSEALKLKPGLYKAKRGLKLARLAEPESALRGYYSAINDEDYEEAYSYLSASGQKAFTLAKFSDDWRGVQPQLHEFKILNRSSKKAVILGKVSTSKGGFEAKFTMVFEQDGWRFNDTIWQHFWKKPTTNPTAVNNQDDAAIEMLVLYYQLIDSERFSEAYNLRSSRSHNQTSFTEFKSIWSNNVAIKLGEIENKNFSMQTVNGVTTQSATISADLIATDTNRKTGKPSTTTYKANIRLIWENEAWRYDGGDFVAAGPATMELSLAVLDGSPWQWYVTGVGDSRVWLTWDSASGSITGRSHDKFGDATYSGSTDSSGQIILLKVYISGDQPGNELYYKGRLTSKSSISGSWSWKRAAKGTTPSGGGSFKGRPAP